MKFHFSPKEKKNEGNSSKKIRPELALDKNEISLPAKMSLKCTGRSPSVFDMVHLLKERVSKVA